MPSRDDDYYRTSFLRIRDHLTRWCLSEDDKIGHDFSALPTSAISLFPYNLRELESSGFVPLYGTSSGFRSSLLQATIAKNLVEHYFAAKASSGSFESFITDLKGFFRNEPNYHLLVTSVLKPTLDLSRAMICENRIMLCLLVDCCTSFDISAMETLSAARKESMVCLCLFPLLVVKEESYERVVLVKSSVSMLDEWSNQIKLFPRSETPLAFIDKVPGRNRPKPVISEASPHTKGTTTHTQEKAVLPFNYSENYDKPAGFKHWKVLAIVFVLLFVAAVGGMIGLGATLARHKGDQKNMNQGPSTTSGTTKSQASVEIQRVSSHKVGTIVPPEATTTISTFSSISSGQRSVSTASSVIIQDFTTTVTYYVYDKRQASSRYS